MTPVESAKPRAGIPESPGIPRSRAEGAVQPAAQGEVSIGMCKDWILGIGLPSYVNLCLICCKIER